MGEQLQNLAGFLPALCAIKPHGSYFPFYSYQLLGSPNIIVSGSGEEKEEGGAYYLKILQENKLVSSEDRTALHQTKDDRRNKTMFCDSPADRKTLVGPLHQIDTTM